MSKAKHPADGVPGAVRLAKIATGGIDERSGFAKKVAGAKIGVIDMRTRQEEVDLNFEAFQKELPSLLLTRRGQYALMRSQEITGFYDTIRDAQTAATQLYPDALFSIQQVTNTVGDLGFFSHAVHLVAP